MISWIVPAGIVFLVTLALGVVALGIKWYLRWRVAYFTLRADITEIFLDIKEIKATLDKKLGGIVTLDQMEKLR